MISKKLWLIMTTGLRQHSQKKKYNIFICIWREGPFLLRWICQFWNMNSIFQVKYVKPFTLCYINNKDREYSKPTGSNQKKIISVLAYSSHLCILIADLYSQTLHSEFMRQVCTMDSIPKVCCVCVCVFLFSCCSISIASWTVQWNNTWR